MKYHRKVPKFIFILMVIINYFASSLSMGFAYSGGPQLAAQGGRNNISVNERLAVSDLLNLESANEQSDEGATTDEETTGNLEITKVDADDEEKLLEGAEFKLYYEEDDRKYFFSEDDEENIIWVENEKEATILTTDEQGELSVEGLPKGTYSLLEIQAPEGYITPEEEEAIRSITIKAGETTEEIIKNILDTGDLRITKVDIDDEEKLLKGAEFKLYYEEDDKRYYFSEDDKGKITWVEKEEEATILTTDDKGELSVEGLPVGTYFLVETQAPDKYVTPEEDKAVTEIIIERDEKTEKTIKNTLDIGDLKVIKVDADDEKKLLEGAEFKLYYEEDDTKYYYSEDEEGKISWVEKEKEATILTTDEQGELSVEGLVVGTYSLVEITAPEGYLAPEEEKAVTEITIKSDESTEKTIANTLKAEGGDSEAKDGDEKSQEETEKNTSDTEEGSSEVTDNNEEGENNTSEKEDVVTEDNVTGEQSDEETIVKNIDEPAVVEGIFPMPRLASGEISEDTEGWTVTEDIIPMPRVDIGPPTFIINKVNEEGIPVFGARFELYSYNNNISINRALPSNINSIYWTHVDFYQGNGSNLIDLGQLNKGYYYLLRETEVPENYEPSEYMWFIEVNRSAQVKVTRIKAEFDGSYITFVEEEEDILDGRLTYDPYNHAYTLEIENKRIAYEPISFEFTKIDADTGIPLSDAVFYLEGPSGGEQNGSGPDGRVTFNIYESGFYILTEEAPDGYKEVLGEWEIYVDDPGDGKLEIMHFVSLDSSNAPDVMDRYSAWANYGTAYEYTDYVLPNEPKPGDFKFTKVDAANGYPLEGAKFQLYYEDGGIRYYYSEDENENVTWLEWPGYPATPEDPDDPNTFITTDELGTIEFSGLRVGTYTLKETSAPRGYETPTRTWEIMVQDNGSESLVIDPGYLASDDEVSGFIRSSNWRSRWNPDNGDYDGGNYDTDYLLLNEPTDFILRKLDDDAKWISFEDGLPGVMFNLYGHVSDTPVLPPRTNGPLPYEFYDTSYYGGPWEWNWEDLAETQGVNLVSNDNYWDTTDVGWVTNGGRIDERITISGYLFYKYKYLILEEITPEGYQEPENNWLIFLDDQGEINVIKFECRIFQAWDSVIYKDVYRLDGNYRGLEENGGGTPIEIRKDGIAPGKDYYVLRNKLLAPTTEFEFTKVDASDNTTLLSGAEFTLYRISPGYESFVDENDLVTTDSWGFPNWPWEVFDTYTSGSDISPPGLVNITGLEPGTYQLVETNALGGYVTPTGQWRIEVVKENIYEAEVYNIRTIQANDGTKTPEIERIGMTDEYKLGNVPKTTDFEFTKVDETNGYPLEGAEFQLSYQRDNVGWYYSSDIDENGDAVWKDDSEDSSTFITTEGDGTIKFSNIPVGTYTLKETSAPRGYKRATGYWSFDVELVNGELVVRPPEYHGDATLEFMESNGVGFPDGYTGEYATEYLLPNEPTEFILKKIDGDTNQPLKNAKFNLYGYKADTPVVLKDFPEIPEHYGLPSDFSDLYVGDYFTIYEYRNWDWELMENPFVDVGSSLVSNNDGWVTNMYPDMYIEDPITISHQMFSEYKYFILEEVQPPPNQYPHEPSYQRINNQWLIFLDNNGEVKIINIDCRFLSDNGEVYRLDQITSLLLNNAGISLEKSEDKTDDGKDYYVLRNFLSPTTSFEFTKVDENGKPLNGAAFTLYKLKDDKEPIDDDELTTENPYKWEVVNTYPSESYSIFGFGNLERGIYQLVETEAPIGYDKPTGEWRFFVSEVYYVEGTQAVISDIRPIPGNDGTMPPEIVQGSTSPYQLENVPLVTDFTFTKVDEINREKLLPGATFRLYYKDGVNHYYKGTDEDGFAIWTTNEDEAVLVTSETNGQISFEGLSMGDYILEETEVPDDYQAPTGFWKVTIGVDADEEETLIVTGIESIPEVEGGTHPPSFSDNYSKLGNIAEEAETVEFTFTKVDASDYETTLPGAKFTLYKYIGEGVPAVGLVTEDSTNWKNEGSYENGDEGFPIVVDLATGIYQLVETKAPQGYQLPTGQWRFEVNAAAGTITDPEAIGEAKPPAIMKDEDAGYLVGNIKSYTLPATGNGGIYWLITLGGLLLAIGLARFKYVRRSQ